MAIKLDNLLNDLIGEDLIDRVRDVLDEIDFGNILGGVDIDDVIDDITDAVESFYKTPNLGNLVGDFDELLDGVDLSTIDFDELLQDFLGDVSLNRLLDNLDNLVGDININDLFGDADLNDFADEVRDIVNSIVDDFDSGVRHVVEGNSRSNRLKGFNASDIITGGRGGDSLLGFSGNDILLGGPNGDTLLGARGDDILYGGIGQEILLGGLGKDIFALGLGAGRAIMRDYWSGIDQIAILGNLDPADLTLSQRGLDTLISYGSDLMGILKNVNANTLNASDFINTR